MGTLIKECERCGDEFKADPRLGLKKARVCAKALCLQWRAAQGKRQWRENNPDYDTSLPDRHRTGYWKEYRGRHPEKVQANRVQTRERMRGLRRMFATQDSIRRDPDGYLARLLSGAMFATQDSIDGRLQPTG